MNNEVVEEVAKLNERCTRLVGRRVVEFIGEYGRTLISLHYGDKEYKFNPDGYNTVYVVKTLYNNPVINAILR